MSADERVDLLADCAVCGHGIEHFAGTPGSEFMTPYWRPIDGEPAHPHPVVPNPDTIREARL